MKKVVDLRGNQIVPSWRGIVVCRIKAISKIAGKALNYIENSAFFEAFGFRGLPKFTRAVGAMLQTSKPDLPLYLATKIREGTIWFPLKSTIFFM